MEQVQAELPSLKRKTRLKGFVGCFSIGCCLMMLSTIFIPTIMIAPGSFARTYTAVRRPPARACTRVEGTVLGGVGRLVVTRVVDLAVGECGDAGRDLLHCGPAQGDPTPDSALLGTARRQS